MMLKGKENIRVQFLYWYYPQSFSGVLFGFVIKQLLDCILVLISLFQKKLFMFEAVVHPTWIWHVFDQKRWIYFTSCCTLSLLHRNSSHYSSEEPLKWHILYNKNTLKKKLDHKSSKCYMHCFYYLLLFSKEMATRKFWANLKI